MEDWFDEAKRLYKPGVYGYRQIAKKLDIPHKTVCSRFLRAKKIGEVSDNNNYIQHAQPRELSLTKESLIGDLAKAITIDDLCDRYNQSERVIKASIEDLKDEGYQILEQDENIKLCKDVINERKEHEISWNGDKIIRFGVVSDNHFCSKWQQLTFLNHLYDIFQREGIPQVFNAGDITEGFKMRQGHEHEIFKHGADEQTDYVIDNYPYREGTQTLFITGNHDHSHIKNGGIDIGKRITDKRPDMTYLGLSNAKVHITPSCTVEVNHPLDGSSYALSYSLQKAIDAMPSNSKPSIFLNGHHHKMFYMIYRNIHAFECGTTQAQTSWMRGKRLAAHIGGFIVEVHVNDEGTITRCKNEFIPLYEPLENDY